MQLERPQNISIEKTIEDFKKLVETNTNGR
jgi:hypothetical protein